jgi:hypothetical protein
VANRQKPAGSGTERRRKSANRACRSGLLPAGRSPAAVGARRPVWTVRLQTGQDAGTGGRQMAMMAPAATKEAAIVQKATGNPATVMIHPRTAVQRAPTP